MTHFNERLNKSGLINSKDRQLNSIKIKTLTLLIATLFGASQSVWADGNLQGLLEIYKQAELHDSSWASAKSTYAATQEKVVQGRALILPSVTLDAEANQNNSDTTYSGSAANPFTGGRQNFGAIGYNVNLTQPLWRKQNTIQYEQSKVQVAQAENTLSVARLDLMVRTATAYFDVLLAQDKITLIVAQKAAVTRQLDQAKANFDVGTATITDVNEAQAKFDLLLAQEIATQNDFEVKKRAIQAITTVPTGQLASAKDKLNIMIPAPQDMEEWVKIAEEQNPQIKVQDQSVQIATQEIDRAHAGHYPTLDAVATWADNRSNGGVNAIGSDQQQLTIGVKMEIPIYQGGSISSKEREAASNQQKAQDDVDLARHNADFQTRQAYLTVASTVAQVKAFEQALISSQSSMDSTSLGYEVGVRTSVDVLNAQQQLYSAKRDLLEARYTWMLSVIKLKAAAGVLSEKDFADTNNLLEGL
jgi:outer membrane protein